MAILAFQAEEPGMDLWLSVACRTGSGRSAEFLASVAILASDLCVAPVQRKDQGMVETMHAIYSIMASQAIRAVFLRVLFHKAGRVLGMAVHARLGGKGLNARRVAASTRDRLSGVIPGMARQAERGSFFVREWRAIQNRRRPAGWGMAVAAGCLEYCKVDGRFGMAAGAFHRRVPERLARLL